MKSLRKTMRKITPVILSVLLLFVTLGCDILGFNHDEILELPPGPPDKVETFAGVQTVLVTNASGALMESDLKITATIKYLAEGEIVITLCDQFNGNPRECQLEGDITSNNSIRVEYVANSATTTYDSDGELNTSFEEFFGLSAFNLQDDCPQWYGTLENDKLEISCNFCCNANGKQDTATGKITCSLDQM